MNCGSAGVIEQGEPEQRNLEYCVEPEQQPVNVTNSHTGDESAKALWKEGGYGWVVVLAVWLVNAHTWGINSVFAVFLAHYLRSDHFVGATSLDYAFVGGLSVAMACLVSPLATKSVGRLGTRKTMWIGVVLQAASFIAASFAKSVWQLVLGQGVCFGIGIGFLFTSTVGLVPQWFVKRRSFANAIATSGSGFGGLTYSLVTSASISSLGLAWTFRILGIVSFAINGFCSVIVRDRNRELGCVYAAFHKALLKKLDFWLYLGWSFFNTLSYVIVVSFVSDYAQHVGFSTDLATLATALFNLSQGLGRPAIGLLSDKFGRLNIAGLGTLIASLVALFLWIFAAKYSGGLIVYALCGVFAGVFWPTSAPVGAKVVGIRLLPAALSITWIVVSPPTLFAEVISLELRKSGINGYLDVQVFAGLTYFGSFLCIWFLRSRKIDEMDNRALIASHEANSQDEENVSESVLSPIRAGPVRPNQIFYFKAMFRIVHV